MQNLHRRVACSVWGPEVSQKLSWPLSVHSAAPPGYSAPQVCCWETVHWLHTFNRFRNHQWSCSLLQSYQTADILHTDINYKYFIFTFHYTFITSKNVSYKSTSEWHQHVSPCRIISEVSPRSLRIILPSVRRTKYSPKESAANFSILYVWPPPPTMPQGL